MAQEPNPIYYINYEFLLHFEVIGNKILFHDVKIMQNSDLVSINTFTQEQPPLFILVLALVTSPLHGKDEELQEALWPAEPTYLSSVLSWERLTGSSLGLEGRGIQHSAFGSCIKCYVKHGESLFFQNEPVSWKYCPCSSTIDLTVALDLFTPQRKPILFSKGIINKSVFISIHQSIERKFACSKGYFCLLAEILFRNVSQLDFSCF